jgi:ornithine cyclodeaminase/alanine dehydrogenase-like protein (mu-crystallin family)
MPAIAACCRDISRYRFWDTFNLTSCAWARLPPLVRDLGKPVKATKDWRDCVEGADIVVEASRLTEPAPMLKTA